MNWPTLEGEVDAFLAGRTLDYIFLTHQEFPHGGLVEQWMRKFPNAIAVGDLSEYRFYYPELFYRMKMVEAGDYLDLGDRKFVFVPAIWRDLNNSLWGFDDLTRTLFVSDAFAYLHYHERGEADLMTSEMSPPDVKMCQYFNERALQWTNHVDAQSTFGDIDELLALLKPRMIAPAHGGIVDTIGAMVPVVKSSMAVKKDGPATGDPL